MGRYQTDEDVEALASGEFATTEQDADEPPEEAPDEGTPDEGDDAEEAPDDDEPEPAAQDADGGDEPMYAVTIDGTEVQVPVSELRKGYMRTGDYTRKTQRLAAQQRQNADAEALRQALERNPNETLRVLARHYRVDMGDYDPDENPGPTPEQVRLAELEQRWEAQEARQRESEVNAEIDRLHREYGDFDEDALFGFAVDKGVRDLEVALRAMTFARTTPSKTTEKRKVAAVAGGQGRNGAAHPKTPPEKITKFDDAYQAALRELQITS